MFHTRFLISCCLCAAIQPLCSVIEAPAQQPSATAQQPSFAVAVIRPSAAPVPFVRAGKTDATLDTLRMQDVTVAACIEWAYHVQDSQIAGPDWVRSEHFEITAKTDNPVPREQMRLMMKSLLAERFHLSFRTESRKVKGYALVSARRSMKLKPAAVDAYSRIENSAMGFIAKSTTMPEFADYLVDPMQTPVVDETGLAGKYDFSVDFTSYLPADSDTVRPDVISVMMITLEGELGLKLEPRKVPVNVLVIDHIEKPTAN
jgi:uncharacterized protein (TIGR03435 family)